MIGVCVGVTLWACDGGGDKKNGEGIKFRARNAEGEENANGGKNAEGEEKANGGKNAEGEEKANGGKVEGHSTNEASRTRRGEVIYPPPPASAMWNEAGINGRPVGVSWNQWPDVPKEPLNGSFGRILVVQRSL